MGAIVGTIVPGIVLSNKQAIEEGRLECYQIVLPICDFDMVFTFVWAGREGVTCLRAL